MKVLHQIGDRALGGNFNTLEEILAYDGPISFDGIYMSVYENYKALKGKDITLFFSGKYLGGDNSFDVGQPLSKFCTWEQIKEMAEYLDAKIGYHGWAHLRCKGLSASELIEELTPPPFLTQYLVDYPTLAWPYGDYDDDAAISVAACLGYNEAWSVHPKHNDLHSLTKNRTFLNWDHYDDKGNNLGKFS